MPVSSGCKTKSMQLKCFKRALLFLQCVVLVDLDPLDNVLGE